MLGVVLVSNVEFHDYSMNCMKALKEAGVAFLEEAGGEVESQTKRNCAVVTGKTKGSFQHQVDEGSMMVQIGSNYENAIWEEFGTGLYALEGDGRKDVPWWYKGADGVWHSTSGKHPKRMLFNAFESLRGVIQQMAERKFGDIG